MKEEKKELKIKIDVLQLLQLVLQLIQLLLARFKWAMALSALISFIILRYDDFVLIVSLIKELIVSFSTFSYIS